VNLSLENLVVDVYIKIRDLRTGAILFEQVLLSDFLRRSHCITEFPDIVISESNENNARENAAIHLIQ
jgi:hypothetical protein